MMECCYCNDVDYAVMFEFKVAALVYQKTMFSYCAKKTMLG